MPIIKQAQPIIVNLEELAKELGELIAVNSEKLKMII